LSGLLAGLVFLVYKLKKDIIGITYYAFDIMEQVKEDQNIMKQGSGQENQSERMSLLFKGIIHIVMIPILGKAMAEKVPIVGGFASGLLEKILSGIASRFKFDEKDATIGKEVNSSENSEFNQELFSSRIAASKEGVRKVVGFTTNIARYPLLFVLFISLFMLFIFIYIIN